MEKQEYKERYENLDGLRAISCLCIIAYHIEKFSNYQLSWEVQTLVASCTHFVPLFLLISGFGIFCGYYEKVKTQSFDVNTFYKKRYQKIMPFFVFLLLINVILERSVSNIIEALTEATLLFGLLPNNKLEVMEVAWAVGLIFVFYMLFPFVAYLCWTKKRAIITLVVSVVLSLFCSNYFFTEKFVVNFTDRHNFLYCAPFFVAGGVTYLYRDRIQSFVSRYRIPFILMCIVLSVLWYFTPDGIGELYIMMLKNLILFLPWLWYCISIQSKFLSNKVMKFFSGISFELYLAQMIIFRLVEKLDGLYLLGNGWIGFITTWIIVVGGLIIFIEIWKLGKKLVTRRILSYNS